MPTKSFVKLLGLFLLLSIGPLSIYLLYKQTGGLESRQELAFHKNIRFAFMAGASTVKLESLTPWTWETVCAFGAGLNQIDINNLVGFTYADFSQLTWRNLEDHWTLLFIGSERETNWGSHRPTIPIRIPVNEIADYDFSHPLSQRCVNNSAYAVLSISRKDVPLGRTPVIARLVDKSELDSEKSWGCQ